MLLHRVADVFLQIIHLQAVACLIQRYRFMKASNLYENQIQAHLIIDLGELDKDGERQAEEQVAHHRPAAAEIFEHPDGGDEPLPRILVHVNCTRRNRG